MPASIEQQVKFRDVTAGVFGLIEKEFTIVPKIPLIQSSHESNWGLSELSAHDKNIFGITPGDQWLRAMRKEIPMEQVTAWSKLGTPTVYYPTTEYSDYPPNKIHYWEFPGDIVDKKGDGREVIQNGEVVNAGGSILTVKRYFRQYQNWDESAWDWARKISGDPRYRFAYEAAKAGDVQAYAAALQKAGYAQDPSYDAALIARAKEIDALPMC